MPMILIAVHELRERKHPSDAPKEQLEHISLEHSPTAGGGSVERARSARETSTSGLSPKRPPGRVTR
jgi:hypothetical protein